MVDYYGLKKIISCLSNSLIILLAVFIFSAPAPASIVKIEKSGTLKSVVVPGDDYELCADLIKNQKFEYSFKASSPVIFNLHYHVKNKTRYPVRSSMMVRRTASYQATENEEHCLMWTNYGRGSVSLEVFYKIHFIKR